METNRDLPDRVCLFLFYLILSPIFVPIFLVVFLCMGLTQLSNWLFPGPTYDLSYINREFLPVHVRTVDYLLMRCLIYPPLLDKWQSEFSTSEREEYGDTPLWDRALRRAAYSDFQASQYTGFVASFYPDGQLAYFTYFIDGHHKETYAQLSLHYRKKKGSCGECYEYMGGLAASYSHYERGRTWSSHPFSDEDWSDGRPIEFSDWLRNSVDEVVNAGNVHLGNQDRQS